jgi:hypothetical protein
MGDKYEIVTRGGPFSLKTIKGMDKNDLIKD